jgi:hypothetical protein
MCSPTSHPLSGPLRFAVPALHVFGVGAQVGARFEEPVVEVEVQVVGLDVVHDKHRRNRPGNLPKVSKTC